MLRSELRRLVLEHTDSPLCYFAIGPYTGVRNTFALAISQSGAVCTAINASQLAILNPTRANSTSRSGARDLRVAGNVALQFTPSGDIAWRYGVRSGLDE